MEVTPVFPAPVLLPFQQPAAGEVEVLMDSLTVRLAVQAVVAQGLTVTVLGQLALLDRGMPALML